MKRMVITGASAGIGAAAAIALSRLGHEVVAVGRSARKLSAVRERMRAVAPAGLIVPEPVAIDLAVQAQVVRLASLVMERCPKLDVLVNNAGVQPVSRQVTADGIELVFAVNHLAPFLLTTLLAERLAESHGRVITTASSNHATGTLDFEDLQFERSWTSGGAYDRSKLANVLFTIELARRTGLSASSFHPGSITTELNRDSRWYRVEKIFEWFAYGQPERGADTLVWLATESAGGAPQWPCYYVDRTLTAVAPLAQDAGLASRLWDASEQLVSASRSHA